MDQQDNDTKGASAIGEYALKAMEDAVDAVDALFEAALADERRARTFVRNCAAPAEAPWSAEEIEDHLADAMRATPETDARAWRAHAVFLSVIGLEDDAVECIARSIAASAGFARGHEPSLAVIDAAPGALDGIPPVVRSAIEAVRSRADAPMPPGVGYRIHHELGPEAWKRFEALVRGEEVPPLAPTPRPVVDNPEFDGTDGAHPAWWRGQAHAEKQWLERVAEAESARDAAREQLAALQATGFAVWDLIGEVANACEPCELEDGTSLVPSDELLTKWGNACHRACALLRGALPAQRPDDSEEDDIPGIAAFEQLVRDVGPERVAFFACLDNSVLPFLRSISGEAPAPAGAKDLRAMVRSLDHIVWETEDERDAVTAENAKLRAELAAARAELAAVRATATDALDTTKGGA